MDAKRDIAGQDARYLGAAAAFGAAIERLATGYEADAELRRDLVQEIHVALWRSFAAFDGRCSERTWVYRVAHNAAADHVRARRRLRADPVEHGDGALLELDWHQYVALGVVALIFAAIWWANRAAARTLQREIEALDALDGER